MVKSIIIGGYLYGKEKVALNSFVNLLSRTKEESRSTNFLSSFHRFAPGMSQEQ